jgi:hypothetical protein
MTTPDPDEVNYFLEQLSSADAFRRATALRSQAGRPLADPRLLARAEELLSDTTPCLLQIPYEFGEVRWRAAQAVAALRAALGKLEPVELRDAPVSIGVRKLAQLAEQHGLTSDQRGNEAMLDYFAQLRDRGLLPRRDIMEDPAFYREPA